MSVFVWACHRCGSTGAAVDEPAGYVAGLDHVVEAHPFEGDASDVSVTVAS